MAVGVGFEHASDEFISEGGFSCAACACDAEDRGFLRGLREVFSDLLEALCGVCVAFGGLEVEGFKPSEGACDIGCDAIKQAGGEGLLCGEQIAVGADHHIADHADKTESSAIFHRINLVDALAMEGGDLFVGDGAAAAAKDGDIGASALREKLHHISEVLHVSALIGRDGDAVCVFFDGCGNDLSDRSVVSEVDHFGPFGLKDTAHDIDGGVVSIEETGRRNKAQALRGGPCDRGLGMACVLHR